MVNFSQQRSRLAGWLACYCVMACFCCSAFSQVQSKQDRTRRSPTPKLPFGGNSIPQQALQHLSDAVMVQQVGGQSSSISGHSREVVPAQHSTSRASSKLTNGNVANTVSGPCGCSHCCALGEGSWDWVRNEEEERRRAIRIYNSQCVRCHGVQGKGVWDIPDVPNFTNRRWQQSRSDGDIVRLTLGGRGACMPAFKGTITTAEAWAIARYIRTLGLPAIERETTDDQKQNERSTPDDNSTKGKSKTPEGPQDAENVTAEEARAVRPNFLRSR